MQGDDQRYESNACLGEHTGAGQIDPSPKKQQGAENKQKPHPQNKAQKTMGHTTDQVNPEILYVD